MAGHQCGAAEEEGQEEGPGVPGQQREAFEEEGMFQYPIKEELLPCGWLKRVFVKGFGPQAGKSYEKLISPDGWQFRTVTGARLHGYTH